jgi:flavin-dependent dehydrogenase
MGIMRDGKRVVVIGGDAAGMSAASQARRQCPDLQIVAFERGAFTSYSACGMTAEEFMYLDLSYAPPFAPVWDPTLIAARKAAEQL